MDSKEFCYWLQGFCELTDNQPNPAQWEMKKHIRESLECVAKTVEELHKHPSIPNKEDALCMLHGPLSYPRDICSDVACTPTPSNKKLC